MTLKEPYCSFCGKNQEEVAKLVAGPGVHICNECHHLMTDMMPPPRVFQIEQEITKRVRDGETKNILDRIEKLHEGPETLHFELTFDQENNIWLGRQRWVKKPDKAKFAEGATPAEVLRKLAEMLE